MFQANSVENIETHILCSTTFFRRSYILWDVGIWGKAGQATDENTEHVLWMLEN